MDVARLAKDLMRDESVEKFPYVDTVGKITIGVGRNLTDRGLRSSEIMYMLRNDIEETVAELNRALPWWKNMNEVRQRVLANMCFNMGINTLLGFRNTLAAMQRGDYDAAAEGMLKSLWAKQVGLRAVRLAQMMKEGK